VTIQLRFGRPGPGQTRDLLEAARASGPGRVVWCVRAQPRRRELQEELGRGALGATIATLPEWIAWLHDRMPGRRPIIAPTPQHLLIERLLLRLGGSDPEHPFRDVQKRPGLVPRVRQAIAHVKQRGVATPTQLSKLLSEMTVPTGGLVPMLRGPLEAAFAAYRDGLAALGLIDPEDAYAAVAEALDAGTLRDELPELLILEGQYQLNDVQKRVLRALAERVARIDIVVEGAFPGVKEREGWPHITAVDGVHATAMEFWDACGATARRVDGWEWGAELRATYDRLGGLKASESAALPGLRFRRFATLELELREVARALRGERDAATKAGKPMPRQALLYPSLEGITPLIEEIFPRHGLPLRLIDRRRLVDTPPGALLRHTLAILRMGAPVHDVRIVFESPLVKIDGLDDGRRTARALDALERLGGVPTRGVESWQRCMENALQRLARRESLLLDAVLVAAPGDVADAANELLAKTETCADAREARGALRYALRGMLRGDDGDMGLDDVGDDDDDALGPHAAARALAATLDAFELMEHEARRVVETLASWRDLVRPGAAAPTMKGIERVLGSLSVDRALTALGSRAARDWDAWPLDDTILRRDLAAWHEAMAVVRQASRLLVLEMTARHGADASISLDDVHNTLMEALREAELSPQEPDDADAVEVLSRLDARQRRFDTLWVAGLDTNAAPGRRKADIFFTDEERALGQLRTHDDAVREWRHLVAMWPMSASRVTMSWSGGPEVAPSSLIEELGEAAGIALRDVPLERGGVPQIAYSQRDALLAWMSGRRATPTVEIPLRRGRVTPPMSRVDERRTLMDEHTRRPALSCYNGTLTIDAQALHPLKEASARPSPTLLDDYASCPFHAWMGRLAGLRSEDETDRAVARLKWGRRLHRLLAVMFETARGQNDRLWSEEDVERARDAALAWWNDERQVADRALEADLFFDGKMARLLSGWLPEATSRDALEPPEGALPALLRWHRLAAPMLRPMYLEASLGKRPGSGSSISDTAVSLPLNDGDTLAIPGTLDRLDAIVGGGQWVVIDYKSGKGHSFAQLANGEKFQLPLYAGALRHLRRRGAFPGDVGGALYVSLRTSGVEITGFAGDGIGDIVEAIRDASKNEVPDVTVKIERVTDFDAFLDAVAENAGRARAAALRGHFPVSAETDAPCADCVFRRVSRWTAGAAAGWTRRYGKQRGELGMYEPQVWEA